MLSGVPQESTLGPLLFTLYINDLHSIVKSSSLKMYADDVALYTAVSSYQDCVNLKDDLARIYDWSHTWQLNLSPGKCEICSTARSFDLRCESVTLMVFA